MGMITEGQIVQVTEATNELLSALLAEVRRTNQLLEWLGQQGRTDTTMPEPGSSKI